jgi:nicotinamidase-related amidase
MTNKISDTLLTPETSLVLIIDYQSNVLDGIASTDHALIELNGLALARAAKAVQAPIILTTIGVKNRGEQPTLPAIRQELAHLPELDRETMNAWDDEHFRAAVEASGRRRLIFAGLWTEVCMLYPVLHAQREGFETYFVVDATGGATVTSHATAIRRMIQAGSQPLTLNSLITEWIRDWGISPHGDAAAEHLKWYTAEIDKLRAAMAAKPFQPIVI